MTADPDVRFICGRTDTVTTIAGRELLFRCDRELWHYGRHHAANVDGVEMFWERSRRHPEPDPLRAPETDDEPWPVYPPETADRRPVALAVLIVALVVVAIVWWPRA